MNLARVTVRVEAARNSIERMITHCFDTALDKILAKVNKKHAESEAAIQGLREQIQSNVTILMPNMKHGTGAEFSVNTRVYAAPQLQIITSGSQRNVSAYIMVGSPVSPKLFIYGDKAATSSMALVNLLNVTQTLLEGQIGEMLSSKTNSTNRTTRTMRTTRATTTTTNESNHARVDSGDDGFWDSTAVNNGSFHDLMSSNDNADRDSAYESGDGENPLTRSFGSETTVADSDDEWF